MLKRALVMTQEEFDRTMALCLRGAFLCSREVARRMVEQGSGGSIVHMSSIASAVALGRGTGAYAAAKAGINALVRETAVEWAADAIRVNAIAPCQFNTPSLQKVLNDSSLGKKEDLVEAMVSKIPLGRFGEPDDIVGPALFLASSDSAMVTGQVLFVDGGYTAQ